MTLEAASIECSSLRRYGLLRRRKQTLYELTESLRSVEAARVKLYGRMRMLQIG